MPGFFRHFGRDSLARLFSSRHRRVEPEEALGRALLAALEPGNLDETEEWLSEVVRRDSDAVSAYLALARVYRRRGEVGRSIHLHQNLLLRRDLGADERLMAVAELAEDFRVGGFLQRALASFEEVLAHEPGHREALRATVSIFADLQDYSSALGQLRRLEKVQKQSDPVREAELLFQLAAAAHAEGRNDAARKAVKRALRRDSGNVDAGILLGRLEAERGRDKAALEAWQRVLAQGSPVRGGDPEEVDLYSMVEASFAALHRARDYEGFLRELLEKRPGDGQAIAALARTLSARGEVGSAIAELSDALDRVPESLELHVLLGRLLLSEGREREALAEFSEILDCLDERKGLLVQETLE
jgi:lipopolysaccharide biosynthesis regulator YciM